MFENRPFDVYWFLAILQFPHILRKFCIVCAPFVIDGRFVGSLPFFERRSCHSNVLFHIVVTGCKNLSFIDDVFSQTTSIPSRGHSVLFLQLQLPYNCNCYRFFSGYKLEDLVVVGWDCISNISYARIANFNWVPIKDLVQPVWFRKVFAYQLKEITSNVCSYAFSLWKNHPPSIIKQIPNSVNKRISSLSSDQSSFDSSAPFYENALHHSGPP